jgi:hypothetical protein
MKQLDEYMKFKGIPAACQMAVAYRSSAGSLSRQWAETVSHQISDYESFRKALQNSLWSTYQQQNLMKCSLHQGRYNRRSNLSLSALFLKGLLPRSKTHRRRGHRSYKIPLPCNCIEVNVEYEIKLHRRSSRPPKAARNHGKPLNILYFSILLHSFNTEYL